MDEKLLKPRTVVLEILRLQMQTGEMLTRINGRLDVVERAVLLALTDGDGDNLKSTLEAAFEKDRLEALELQQKMREQLTTAIDALEEFFNE